MKGPANHKPRRKIAGSNRSTARPRSRIGLRRPKRKRSGKRWKPDWHAVAAFITSITTAVAVVFTGINVVIARDQASVAAKQANIAGEGQITDRFTRAVEQLASEKLEARTGGVYALERIARDSTRDFPAVMNVLAAFVRTHPPSAGEASRAEEPAADLQAALTVIGRRDVGADRSENTPFNLVGAQLTGIDLAFADLSGTNLARANLARSYLPNADLAATDLRGANLRAANLANARIAPEMAAELIGSTDVPEGANLSYAELMGADLTGANLTGTNLSGADLTGANLTGADLRGANLTGTKGMPHQ